MKIKTNKHSILLLIISLHTLLCMPKTSRSAECCKTMSCDSKTSYNGKTSIQFPFRLKDRQPKSCGCPGGFDLFCDDKGAGLLLELPYAGNLTVDNISYYSRQIEVSDPGGCLVQKLLLLNDLNLTDTPFRRVAGGESGEYRLYKCSGVIEDHALGLGLYYEEIDCLKGPNYTIVSATAGSAFDSPNCEFLKTLFVQVRYFPFTFLSSYSSLELVWDEQDCKPCETPTSKTWVAVPVTLLSVFLVCFFSVWWCFRRKSRRDAELAARISSSPSRGTDHGVISHTQSSTTTAPTSGASGGLDQGTIDSYPMVVIGESGRLIKPDDDKCPICLSDYSPGNILKILPECVHRFHSDCIDLWLSTNVTCPICRTSPPHHS